MEGNYLKKNPKIAIIHDWLVMLGGADKVLLQILDCYPTADLFCLVEGLPTGIREKFPANIKSTFIQRLPRAKKWYWYYAPFMPIAIEQIDLTGYDLILSCSHAFAKGVICHPNQLHIAYIHSPMRFAYDLQYDYYQNFSFSTGIKRWIASSIFHYLRIWDARTINNVDHLIANSNFVRKRIIKCYRRSSELLYPGIDTGQFKFKASKQSYYLAGSFMTPFKRLDLIISAFNQMPDKKLLLFGTGHQEKYLKKMAGPNITFLGVTSDENLVTLLQNARAFVFAATEDFGMIMAEAQSCGTPVIAYKKGGASEIIKDVDISTETTGIFFENLTCESVELAVKRFETIETSIQPINCRKNAMRFDILHFKERYIDIVKRQWEQWLQLGDSFYS